jgi:hypothetical protein
MKLMVHNSNIESLTFGKYYYVTETSAFSSLSWVKVLCDDGFTRSIHHSHFITIDEWREKQLDKLDI